ncbi:MAG: PD-(D/E)XK nuclease family protein [Candidatus Obscuribacterales bacterium]
MKSRAGETPAVEILLGPYRSGKTKRVVGDLVRVCADSPLTSGHEALLIAPSARYIEELQKGRLVKEIGNSTSGGIVGLNMSAFYKVCSTILRRGGVSFKVIPKAVRPAIVARALEALDAEGRLEHLKPLIRFRGTCSSVLELIDEFQRAGLSPGDVMSRLSEAAATGSKHVELASVYQYYWKELDSIGFLDEHRLAFSCREYLAREKRIPLYSMVAVDGFDRFNKLQLQVLQQIAGRSERMSICFDYVPEPKDDDEAAEYAWKEKSFADLSEAFEGAELINCPHESEPARASIGSFKTVDRFAEMEEIARQVKGALVEDGLPADQILVVVPSMRKYGGAIESAFSGAGLPYYVDESVSLSNLPLVRFLLDLARLYSGDFPRDSLIGVLRSDYFNLQRFGLDKQDLEGIDKLFLARSASSYRFLRNKGEPVLEKLGAIVSVLTPPDGSKTLTDFVSFIEDVIDECLSREGESEHSDPVASAINDRALREFRGCLASLVQEDIVLNGGFSGSPVDYRSFLSRLEYATDAAGFRRLETSVNPVIICSVDLAPNRKYERVFVAGMVEGEFPRKSRQRGFVSADEVGRWLSYGIDLENPRSHPGFEFALFRSLIERATGRVRLSLPMWDMSGDELLPSFFLTGELEGLVIEEIDPFESKRRNPVSARNFAGGLFAGGAGIEELDNYAHPEIADLKVLIQEPLAMARARCLGEGGFEGGSVYNGYLGDPVGAGSLAVTMPEYWSVSRINDYGKCPFRYWVSNVLKIKPFEEPSADIDPRLLGETYHMALELFYKEIIDRGLPAIESLGEKRKALLQECTARALEFLESNSNVREGEFWHLEKKEIAFRLERFVDKEIERQARDRDSYIPFKVEAAFGFDEEGSAPPLLIRDGERTLAFRGRIDRIDYSQSAGLKVIDYKAGAGHISQREALEGRNMQLPIYMMAAQTCIMPGTRCDSGQYLRVSDGAAIGRVGFKSVEEKEALLEQVRSYVAGYSRAIASGDFSVRPNGNEVCNRCDHQRVCRIQEIRTKARSERRGGVG